MPLGKYNWFYPDFVHAYVIAMTGMQRFHEIDDKLTELIQVMVFQNKAVGIPTDL